MPRILIAGCGYVGMATANLFHRGGWEVEGWTSSPESAARISAVPYRVRAIDITDPAAVINAGGEFDVLIHCASSGGGGVESYRRIYLEGVRNLAAGFPKGILLFTSSTSVYGQREGEWITETSPAEPTRETGRILREAEDVALERSGIVARLAGIYGPGRSALLRKFLAGEAVIEPGERFLNQVHRDDIAAALFFLARMALDPCESASWPLIFNVTDNHPISQRECYEWLGAHLDRPVPASGATSAERKRGNSNKRVSSEKLLNLGWRPRYPTFQTAMTESILPNLDALGV